MLDKAGSQKKINSDIKELRKTVSKLRLTATLLKGESKSNINQVIRQMQGQIHKIKLQAKFDQKNIKSDINKALQQISFKDIDVGISEGKTKLKIQKVIADTKRTVQKNPITFNVDLNKQKLDNQLTTYVSKNSKIHESANLLKQVDSLREKISGINDRDSFKKINQEFQLFRSECAATGYQSKSATDKIKNLIGGATKLGSVVGITSMAISNFNKSLKTIKTNDSILVEISKTSDATKQELEELGNSAFDTGSKFGQLSSDYLTAVQEMNRSGFYGEAGKVLGELSLKAQAAGDLSAETAQKYLLATSAAYDYKGSIEKLDAALSGQNYITNRHSVDMETMASATTRAGSVAANAGVKIDQLSAMVGTISARTKEAGEKTGTGIKSLIINLQNIASDKIVGTLEKANASMTETINGVKKLRSPMAILKDLAKTYNSLDENDPLKSEITTNIGQKFHANQLAALLSGWSDYEKMLKDYSQGMGSADIEAQKTASSLEGTFNRLQNSFDELVNTIVNKNALKGGVGFLDVVLQSAEKLIDTFDMLPVAMAGITGFMTAKNKDYGISQIFNENGKLDLDGNLFGINFSELKHFREASSAIEKWNSELANGVTDIASFNNETVKNTVHLREYLKTCSVDAPASLKGYKSYLKAAGVETNSLRLGTILLNSALSFGLGLAIQGVITGIDKLSNHIGDTEEKAKSLSNSMSNSLSSISENSKSVKELNERYQKLAKGVDIAGNNISLTASDYDEYKNIVSKLSEIMPNLTTMFNAQGEKIGFVGGKLKDANEQYKEYIKNSANKFLTDGNEDGETVDDIVDNWNNKNTKLGYNFIDEVKAAFGGYSKSDIEEIYSSQELLAEYQKLYNMSQEELYDYFDWAGRKEAGIGYALKRFLKIDLEQLKEDGQYVNTLKGDLNSYVTEYKTSVESSAKEIQQIAQYMFLNNENLYNGKLGEDASSYISNIISNLSNDFIKSNFTDEDGELVKAKIQSFVDNLVKAFTGGNGVKIEGLFSKLFTLDTSDLSIEEIKKQVNAYIKQLYSFMKQDGESVEDFKLRIGISEETYIDKDTQPLINNVKEKLQDEYDDKVGELTLDELKIAAEKIDVPEGTLLSWEELTAKIEEAKKAAAETETSTPKTFSEVWNSMGKIGTDEEKKKAQEAKEELLELAEAGQLTWEVLEKSSISSVFKDAGVSIEEATRKINAFIEDSKQLDSMRTGMTAITSAYDEKKNAKDKRVGSNTLKSLYSTLNIDNWDESGLKVWEKYKKAASDAKTPLKEFKNLQDELATSFVTSNNFLSNLNRENQDYYDNELKEMGVTNAHAVTTEILNRKMGVLALQKEIVKKKGKKLSELTIDEITHTEEYEAASDDARKGLLYLYLQQNILSNSKLNMTQKISALQDFIKEIDKAHSKMILLKAQTIYDDTMGEVLEATNGTGMGKAIEKATKNKKDYLSKKAKELIKMQRKLSTTGGNEADDTKKTKDKSKTKKSTQVIDWIARRLDVLQSKIDLTKAKFENLFSLNSKKNNLNTQIAQTTKLLNTQQKAAVKYQKKANSVKLSKSLKNKVKNGQISDSLSSLIATYDESTANKITKYQDYTDKAKQSTKAVQELKKNILDLKKQKYQLYVDNADAKTSAINAQQENAITASSKNSYERSKLTWIKQSYDYQIKIAQLEKDSVKTAQLRAEKEKAIADSYKQQFDNIKHEYDNKVGLNESNIATTQAQVSALEAQGKRVSTSYYSNMIGITAKDKALLVQEKKDLEEKLKNIKVGSDEWFEAKESINSVTQEIYKCDQNMAEFQKTINELELKPFELIASQLESAANHTQFLIDLLSHKDLTSKDAGGITKEGMATLSLYFDKMKNNQEGLNNIHNEWSKFTERVARGDSKLSEDEILAKYEEYSKEARQFIEDNENIKDSAKSLVEEAFNIQLEALNDLIQKYKDALQSQKDLYDFQRKIADQTKKITTIQKQMAALTGDDSEETRARLQQLKISLEEAEQDLKDTEYDKWISDQEDMLDDLTEDFEDFITNALKDTDNLIKCVETAIKENSGMIADVIKEQGYGDADAVGTKYNKDGSYETTVTNYDGGYTRFSYDADGNLRNIISTDSEGNIIYDKSKIDAQKAAEEKKLAAETNAQNAQKAQDAKSKIQTDNKDLLEKIVNTFAKSRSPKSSNEYATSNLVKYGSQMFASENGKGKLLASSDAKNIDSYVKQLKNPDTGKALYNTATADNILNALNRINKEYSKALSNAVKNGVVPSGISGFANGGVVAGTSYYGDKLIAKINSGETVLTKEFTDMLPNTVDIMEGFTKLNISDPIKYLKKSPMQQNVDVGKIEFHLDGSDITDFHTFESAFYDAYKNSNKMQTAIQNSVTSTVLNSHDGNIYSR